MYCRCSIINSCLSSRNCILLIYIFPSFPYSYSTPSLVLINFAFYIDQILSESFDIKSFCNVINSLNFIFCFNSFPHFFERVANIGLKSSILAGKVIGNVCLLETLWEKREFFQLLLKIDCCIRPTFYVGL